MAPLPALPDELVQEILLRLPPDEPACLLRASLISKPWRSRISHPDFLRGLYSIHRTPPLLGFFHNLPDIPHFIPTTASTFSVADPDSASWSILDCRHGRVLLVSHVYDSPDLIVWEPITGNQRCMQLPPAYKGYNFNAAVVCAVDGCDHRDCHGGPFRVVSVFNVNPGTQVSATSACEYSSETSEWGELSPAGQFSFLSMKPTTLVGNSVYFAGGFCYILEYDLAGRRLVAIGLPDTLAAYKDADQTRIFLMSAENGGLVIAEVEGSFIYLWSRDVSAQGAAGWIRSRAINLDNLLGDAGWIQSRAINPGSLLPVAAPSASRTVKVIGYAKEANTIFLCTTAGVFTVELNSEQVKKVYETKMNELSFLEAGPYKPLFPFCSFYIPGKQVAAAGGNKGAASCFTKLTL